MEARLLFVITWWCSCSLLTAQTNFVPNGGFEEYYTCPSHLSQFNGIVKNWLTPTTGTPNYYHACASQPEVGMPYNYFGYKTAAFGSAYAGIMTSNAFREYISVELKSPLRAGQNYRLNLLTSVIRNAQCVSGGLDVLFSNLPPHTDQPGANVSTPPSLSVSIEYRDESWKSTQLCYLAKGGERYLTIGDMHYPVAHHNCTDGAISYYFIDEVVLEEIISSPPLAIDLPPCDLTFPMVLDGAKIAGERTMTDRINWKWEDSVRSQWFTIKSPGNYRLNVQKGHCVQTDYYVRVSDQDCDPHLFIPNIFTPNHDNINDHFELYPKGIWVENITVLDRIGQVVYTASGPGFKWDGRTGSTPCPAGVYVFLIRYKIISSSKTLTRSGSVTLIR